jgi:hypothetical protein
VPPIMRLVKVAVAVVVGLIAVWFEAVLGTAQVKRRKRLRRRERLRVR